jgi:hypothetical protein
LPAAHVIIAKHKCIALAYPGFPSICYSNPEIGRQRHLRTHLLREFQFRRREKFLYTYDFLDLWEWEIRVLEAPEDSDASPGAVI